MDYATVAAKSQLDTRELILLDQEVKNQGKNMILAYVLWYFLGILGAHRFYMKKNGSAVAQLILSLIVIGLPITFVWWIVDAFLLHTWVKDKNREIEARVLNELMNNRQFNAAMGRPL